MNDDRDSSPVSLATSVPRAPGDARLVALDPTGAIVPPHCACCGEPAAASRVERELVGEGSLIVPYCRVCHRHAVVRSTRVLAITLASSLLAVGLAAGLPIAAPWLGLGASLVLVVGTALLPVGVAWWRPPARAPHSSRGRAAWFGPRGLVCTSPRWAHLLAELNGVSVRPCAELERRFSPWMVAGPMLGLALTPFVDWLHHPMVRVVNLTDREIVVSADGRRLLTLPPTSAEHPEAGAETRLPAGRRVLQAHDRKGRLVGEDSVLVRAARQHLYAPGDHEYCFWVETVGYGRNGPATPQIKMLASRRHFWVLPPGIDIWFDRSPAQPAGTRASGGQLTALRQGRCRDAPAPQE